MKRHSISVEIKNIPILDPEANVTYYCYILHREQERLQTFVQDLCRG